jgi:DNA helicase-2/ATP-dependent DNA helicase PcrA
MKFGIPYRIVGGIKFYERKEIKDILSYLKVIQNPHDSVSLLRIINIPSRKIGATTIAKINDYSIRNNISFYSALHIIDAIEDIPDNKKKDLSSFAKFIDNLNIKSHGETASSMIRHVVEYSGYKKMLEADGSVEAESRLENIGELVSVSSKYDSLEGGVSLSIFLEEVSLIADVDDLKDTENSVTLMTLHSAKGLEFPHVFIVGLEEGIFPHSRSLLDPNELEEERRLMYVGVTRAKKSLNLIFANERMLYGQTQRNNPSQFLYDIPTDILESNASLFKAEQTLSPARLGREPIPFEDTIEIPDLSDGDRVFHPTFGEGVVMNVTGGVVTVAFSTRSVGVKKLALSIAPLTKL